MKREYYIFGKFGMATMGLLLYLVLTAVIMANSFADDVIDKVNITVPVSCSLSGVGMNSHNATINNGQYDSTIGETTLTAYCNDNDGFAIYAIGFTDDINGKNVLTNSSLGSEFDIMTGIATSGNVSNWAMELSTISNPTPTYPLTIQNNFDTFQPVPTVNTLVAKRDSLTDIGAAAEGSSLKTVYQAYISPAQAAGTYTGQVKYTLVHPNNNLPNTLTMQNVDEWENSISVGQVVYAVDTRDGQGYKVSRLADGRLWMMDNLDLGRVELSENLTAANTNMPSGIEVSAATFNSWIVNTGTLSATNPEIIPITSENSSTGADTDNYGNKYGTLYNFAAASAGTVTSALPSGDTATADLCPRGWRLPSGRNYGDFYNLAEAYGGLTSVMKASTNPTGSEFSRMMQTDLGYAISGMFDSGAPYGQGSSTSYWTSTSAGNNVMRILQLADTVVQPVGLGLPSFLGSPIRCVLSEESSHETMLDVSNIVVSKMKSLAAGETKQSDDETSDIKAIYMADSLPANFEPSDDNTISSAHSKYPVYIFFDNSNNAGIMYVYSGGYKITMNPQSNGLFYGNTALTDASGVFDWDTSEVTTMRSMFAHDSSLTDLDLSGWNTSKVRSMEYMFIGDKSLKTIDLSGWDTSNVNKMTSMFSVGDSYTGNGQLSSIVGLSSLDTGNVTDMTSMFYGSGQMTFYDISDWNVSKVTSFNHMFCDNFKLESLDLSKWNVSSVKTMYDMFDDNYKLTTIGDVSHWNTVSLIDIGGWLNNASSFVGNNGVLDLSGWNTSNLISSGEVFRATKLRTIDLSGWNFDSVSNDSWTGAGSGIYYEYGNSSSAYRGFGGMFKEASLLEAVYVSQSGLNSFNTAQSGGVNTTDMWSGAGVSSFTVK